MNKKPNVQHGKKFEAELDKAAKPLMSKHPALWERVLDSGAAGNIVAPADCDFKLSVLSSSPGRPYHFWIECKASIKYETFAKGFRSLIRPHQIPAMRVASRAGICCLYFFKSVEAGEVEIWSAPDLYAEYYNKRHKFYGSPILVVSDKNLATLMAEMIGTPQKFMARLRA